jgi:protein-disulfide isomerase
MTSLAQQKEQRAVEAYVAKNLLKGPVKVSFQPPRTAIHLSDKWTPVAGYKDAPISMIAFAGTTCPDCPAFVSTVAGAMEKHKGYLKLNWIHNFNSEDGVARMMAQASLCLDALKPGHSLTFLNDFSQKAATLDENSFYSWVKAKGLDEAAFKTCFVGQQQNELLNQHLTYVKQVGVVANPTLWIEGQMLEGIVRSEDVDRIVEEQIAEKQVSPLSAFMRRFFGKL